MTNSDEKGSNNKDGGDELIPDVLRQYYLDTYFSSSSDPSSVPTSKRGM